MKASPAQAQPIPLAQLNPGHRIGKFEVLELYPEGRGGMARVVRAARLDGRREEVALKISRGGVNRTYFFAAIQKEVEILQKLDHLGVVRIVRVSDGRNPYKERALTLEESPWYFGMECLHGGSLEAYTKGLGRLTLGETCAIARPLAEALMHVHRRGFSHNDVKPDNVIFRRALEVGARFEPVLIDFGVAAKLVRQQVDGSVVYMAPERLQEQRSPGPPEAPVDTTKADVWSMGILVYRMLVGREPFLGLSDRSITSAIMRGLPAPMQKQRPDVPREFDEFIVERCLAKDPRVRAAMHEFALFVERYAGDGRVKRASRSRRKLTWKG
ncbi:MAG: serine/threonine-protein kinase [Chloroflexota bacterium]